MPVLFGRNQTQTHSPCIPISQKVPLCKTDLIGIGIIIFTIVFLLVFLERIVKCVKRRFRPSDSDQDDVEEARSPARSVSPLLGHSKLESKHIPGSDASQTTETEKGSPNSTPIPLYRCFERSESDSSRAQSSLRLLSNPFYYSLPNRKSEVESKNKPQKAGSKSQIKKDQTPPIVRVYDVEEQDITTYTSFLDLSFAAPLETSTPSR